MSPLATNNAFDGLSMYDEHSALLFRAVNNARVGHWQTCYEYLGNLLTALFRENFHTHRICRHTYAQHSPIPTNLCVSLWLYVNASSWRCTSTASYPAFEIRRAKVKWRFLDCWTRKSIHPFKFTQKEYVKPSFPIQSSGEKDICILWSFLIQFPERMLKFAWVSN